MSRILRYYDKPSFTPLGRSIFGNEPIGHYFGIELEVEIIDSEKNKEGGENDKVEIAASRVANVLGNFAICKRDSSLDQGFEICSSPATLSYHKENWDTFFEISGLKIQSAESARCGMHVHISRKPMSDLQVGKIMAFIHCPKNYEFIKWVAQRESNTFNNFTVPRSIKQAKHEHYCTFKRHQGVNLLNHNTVEIRLFKGTTCRADFFKNIEFCHALVKFTFPAARSIEDSLSYEKFLDFLLKESMLYRNLMEHLEKGKYLPKRKEKK